MNEHAKNAEAVFLAALEKAPQERAAYIEDVCTGNRELLLRVHELLGCHDQSQGPLDAPPPGLACTMDDSSNREWLGTQIGPYKLLEEIGEGGFGVVYMAEQQVPVRRKVALKVLKPGMDTKQVVARFEAERQALAIMDHPNIAKVFDGGATPSGRPYFVMELVKGAPITEFCDQNQLTPRQRLELFIHVCQAVQHAHHKGIVHRDLKPSNILVTVHDTTPVVKVIDFGVAKALGQELTDNTLFTGFAQMIGTPLYMSPEQAGQSGLDIDTRSDIYSLGVLLYELLTGTTPFDKERFKQATYEEIRRIIREEEPPKPSTRLSDSGDSLPSISAQRHTEPSKLTKLVRGELDWIVMKALEKDRNRRYETANGFALDVQRYLADEPVLAGPLSWRYRLGKYVRRNKRLLVMAAILSVAVLGITGTVGWAIREQEARSEERARESSRRLALTEQSIRDVLTQARENQAGLRDQLTEKGGIFKLLNNPADWRRAIDRTRAALGRAKDLQAGAEGLPNQLATEIDQLERLVARDESDRNLALRLEKIREERSAIAGGFFDQERATQEYAKVFKDLGLNLQEGAEDEIALTLRRSPLVAQMVSALDDWALYAFFHKQLDWQARLLQINRLADPDPWRDRVRNPAIWTDGAALHELAQEALTHDARSASLSPQMFELVGLLLDRNKRSPETWFKQGLQRFPKDYWLHLYFGNHLFDDRPAEAAGAYRAALAVRPQSSAAWDNLGLALLAQKDLAGAAAAFNKALALDPQFARVWANLGLTLYHQKDLPAAVATLRKAVEFDRKDAKAWNNLGMTLRAQNDLPGAIAAFNKAIQINPKAAKAWNQLANALHDQEDLPGAIKAYKKAIELNPTNAEIRNNLGIAFRDQNDLPAAIAAYLEALEVDPIYTLAWNNLSVALQAQKAPAAAIPVLRRVVELDPRNGEAWNSLGAACRAQGDLPGARAAHKKAVEHAPFFRVAWNNLGAVLHDQKDFAGAVDAFQKALNLDPKDAVAWGNLGNGLRDIGDLSGAIAAYQKSLDFRPKHADTWHNLGVARHNQHDYSAAISAFKKALEFAPKDARIWYSLGNTLKSSNDRIAAIAAYKTAVEHNPNFAQAWNNLAATYIDCKDLPAASAAYQRALKANPKLSEALIGRNTCNQLLRLDQRLAQVLGGAKASVPEQLALADFCVRFHHRYRDALLLYSDVLAKEPKVADDVSKGIRFEAARFALFAATGHDKGADKLDDQERTRLRQQALAWFQSEFSLYGQRLKDGVATDSILIHERLARCQKDQFLARVRDAKETAELSASEQQAWQKLWSDAELMLNAVRKTFSTTSMKGTLTAKERENVHELEMKAGKCYIIDLTSAQFDAYLRLEDGQKKMLAENDDMVEGVILDSRLVFTAPKDGVYRIVATSFQQRGAGAYTLIIREFVVN